MTKKNGSNNYRENSSKPKLFLLSRKGGGYLEIPLSNKRVIKVRLSRRHVKVLLILNKVLQVEDEEDTDKEDRGWLNDEQIAEAYTFGDRFAIPPGSKAITQYRSQVNGFIKKAMKQVKLTTTHKVPQIFLGERDVGVRLINELEIIDLQQRNINKIRQLQSSEFLFSCS